jgi:hypothetical protein
VATSGPGFVPVGTLLQRREVAPPPARRALPASAERPATHTGAAWQPSQELSEAEERIKAMFTKPNNRAASPAKPEDHEKH